MPFSGVFGEFKDASKFERELLEKLIQEYPVDAFGIMNKKFNEKGLCILIQKKNEPSV